MSQSSPLTSTTTITKEPQNVTASTNIWLTAVDTVAALNAYAYKTSAYLATVNDFSIDCSGSFNVTLFSASTQSGKLLNIKNSGVGVIRIIPDGSESIDGDSYEDLYADESMTLQSTGTNWIII